MRFMLGQCQRNEWERANRDFYFSDLEQQFSLY